MGGGGTRQGQALSLEALARGGVGAAAAHGEEGARPPASLGKQQEERDDLDAVADHISYAEEQELPSPTHVADVWEE